MTFTLFMKLLRDIRGHKGQYIACMFIICLGLLLFSGMQSVVATLERARDEFYSDCRLADAFAGVKSMPAGDVETLVKLPGIDAASGRIVNDTRVTGFDGDGRNIYLRLISGAGSPGDSLNNYLITSGKEPDGMQMLVGKGFFDAHRLAIGDEITLITGGREVRIPVSGTAQSPEYVYAVSGGQSLLPDYATFDIAYMPYESLAALLGTTGTVNDLSFTLAGDYGDFSPVLNDALQKYGLKFLYARKDQLSTAMLDEEISGVKAMATSVPSVFLLIAAIIVYMMVKRMVDRQRPQIGTMKAFGYGAGTIRAHYAMYGGFVGFFGGLLGGISGFFMTGGMITLYSGYFSLPALKGNGSPVYILYSILLSLPFCMAASYLAAGSVNKLRPVEAMTPVMPPPGRRVFAEHIRPLWNSFTTTGQMALRNISRSKPRVIFTSVCVMFAFSMCAMMVSWSGMIDSIMMESLVRVQRFDLRINLAGYMPSHSLLSEFTGEDGVGAVETMLSLPVRIFHGSNSRDVTAIGIAENSMLYNLEIKQGLPVKLDDNGMVISHKAAENLGVKAGDTVYVYSPASDDEKTRRPVTISGVIRQNIGENAYMRRDILGGLFEQQDISNSVILKLDDLSYSNSISTEYIRRNGISGIENVEEIRRKTEEMMAPYGTVIMAMVAVGILTGFAIIYNSAVITLSERGRELASMRVLGFTVAETVEVLTIEQAVCAVIGAAFGIPLTRLMSYSMSVTFENDMFSIPAEVPVSAYIWAGIATIMMTAMAIAAVYRKVRALSMTESLKSAE